MWNLLGKISMLGGWVEMFKDDPNYSWMANIFQVLTPVLYAIMGVVGAAGMIYSIILGVNLARADEQSKRDEAKKRLITTLIAVAVTIALIVFFNELLPMIIGAFI